MYIRKNSGEIDYSELHMLTSKDVHPLPQIEEVCECVYVYVCMCVYVCVHVCVTSVRGYEAME